MASSSPRLLLLAAAAAILALSSCFATAAAAATFGFDIHHRFSAPVRRWAEEHGYPGGWWPEKEGTADYYAALARHDRALHRRFLAGSNSSDTITFYGGNLTGVFSSLGLLQYAFVDLGTPKKRFLVGLDTGSGLFWVPCDCLQCAPTKSPNYGKLEMSIYSPNESSTSHTVPCNSSFCELAGQCPGPNSSCPYSAQHVYLNTTSNGTLVEDTLYFITEAAIPKAVEASVVFGCGKVQTGRFLENLAPDGMFGLGLNNLSVPSILASKGIAADSFSMCFGADLYGRIIFGDKGSSDQDETPFIVSSQNPYYIINITETVVGKKKSTTAFKAIVDSGVFFSYFADPIYSELTSAFADQITEKQRQPDPKMPFEYCYDLGPNQTGPSYPTAIDFLTENGSLFPVTTPFFLLSDENENPVGFCLAFFKADGANIIGLNFMTGLRVVFDRERSVLGWKQVNCYSGISTAHSATTPAPAPAPAPISDISDNSDGSSNKTRTAPAPSPSGVSSHLNAMTSIFLMIFMLVVTIL